MHAAGPLSIALANDNWTLSFACDAYSRGETDALLAPPASEAWVNNAILAALAAYSTTAQVGTAISDALGAYSSISEMNTAISDAIDALNVGQYQDAAEVQFLIDQALLPYWTQAETSSFVAGELANYATSASVSSSISSALSSYDDSSQVDSKIITALLDFYTRAEVDQAIADATSGSVDLSNYYTPAETQSYLTNELLAYYPRTELDSLLTATLTQYWTSGRTQTEIDDALAGAGFQTQADAHLRYFVRAPGAESGQIFNLVHIRNLLLEAPLSGDAILGNQSTLRLRCDSWTKAEADGRFLRTNDLGPLDARYFPVAPGVEGGGIFNLIQTQFTPKIIRNLLCQTPLSAQPILGNGSTLQISCDCWSKGQSDTRYPLIANFNSLGQRVTDLENSPGVDPTADLTVNTLTATAFVQTPLLQSAAADLQIRNATTTIRAEDGTLVASFATGSIGLEQDITVRSDRTLNATTADFAQFFVGSTAATGTFASSSSVSATQEITSDLRLEAPLVRCDPTAPWLTVQGGTNGVLVDDTLRINGVVAPEASLPFLSLSGGSSGVQVLSPLLEQIAVGGSGETVGMVIRNASPTGAASLLLDSNNQNGVAELVVLSGGGVQINSFQQFIIQQHLRAGQHGHRAQHRGEQRRGGDLRLRVRESERPGAQGERAGHPGGGTARDLRRGGAADLRPHRRRQGADRLRGPGRAGQREAGGDHVQGQEPGRQGAHGPRLSKALGGLVARGEEAAEAGGEAREEEGQQGRLGLRKWRRRRPSGFSSSWPSARAQAALRSDVARQVLAPKPRSLGKSAAESSISARTLGAATSSGWWSRMCSPGRWPRRSCPTSGRRR